MSRRTLPIVAALLAAVCIGAGGGAAVYAALGPAPTKKVVRQVAVAGAQPTSSTSALSVGQIYRRAHRGVVEITVTTTQTGQAPFGGSQSQQAQGSGFVYDSSGHIVTNQHVVDGATSISVKFSTGAVYKAKLVGADPSTDLAVLQVQAPASLLSPLSLGDSSSLGVGDGVVAIGSPFGLEETVTSGIVSALHRQTTSPNGFAIEDSIQTDAAINHGNSGGPLLDTKGDVVGVTAQIESASGGNDGVGFAVPSDTVRSIVSRLLSSGKVEHAYLGVAIDTATGSTGRAAGAKVAQVRSGTAAARSGLRAGDVITALDGKRIATADQLRRLIDAKRPADTISVSYSRAGRTHTARVKLTTRPS